jgi:hypothetical protein
MIASLGSRLVRVFLEPTEENWDPLVIDLFTTTDGSVLKIPSVGLWGDWTPRRAKVLPFLFRPDPNYRDQIDFGTMTSWPEAFRYGESNLSKKVIVKDQYASFWLVNSELCFKVKAVNLLLVGS